MPRGRDFGKVVFRLDAGRAYGLGHLSRCLSLAQGFVRDHAVSFIVKTDDRRKVEDFVAARYPKQFCGPIGFVRPSLAVSDELDLILQTASGSFLIVDHYTADLSYQRFLRENGLKWLQFDSHARQRLIADLVLHGSPGATEDIYKPLVEHSGTRLLLGPSYAIVDEKFLRRRKTIESRNSVRNVFMCFGGGEDKGATLRFLHEIDPRLLEGRTLTVAVSDRNPDVRAVVRAAGARAAVRVEVDSPKIHDLMAEADLAIVSPGTLSYEAASVGLPMILVTLADNQVINARGWADCSAAVALGEIETLDPETLNNGIDGLIRNPDRLKRMSMNALSLVDGHAVGRIREAVLSVQ